MDFKKNPGTKFKTISRLSEKEAKKEIKALREGIEYHNKLYYERNKPEISDSTYDKLFHRLENLERAFPEYKLEDSPTEKVGATPVKNLKKRKHTSFMASLKAVSKEKDIVVVGKKSGSKLEKAKSSKLKS